MSIAETSKVDRRFSLGLVGAAAVILALLLAIFSAVVVETGQTGVVLRLGADASSRVLADPGVYFRLPFVERVWLIDTRLQTAEQSTLQTVTTQDGQSLQISGWVAWRVTDPGAFNISMASGKNVPAERVLAAFAKTLQGVALNHSAAALQQGLMPDDRQRWLAALNAELSMLGIVAEAVGLRQISLSDSANEVIYKRMAESRQQAEKRLIQGLSADEQQLVALQTQQRDQVLGDAYKQSQQKRQTAESKLIAAYAKQYGQATTFQDRLKAQPAAVTTPVGADATRSE